MPRKLPPFVERNHVKGHTYLSFRIARGRECGYPPIRPLKNFVMPMPRRWPVMGGSRRRYWKTIGALITSYLGSEAFRSLGGGGKSGYRSRMDQSKRDHGHRAVPVSRRSALRT